MYFLNTRDLLFFTLSLGVVFLVIFICLVLYQLMKVLKNFEEITKNFVDVSEDVSHTSNLVTKIVDSLYNKTNQLGVIITNLIPKIKEIIVKSKNKKKKSNK